MLQNRNPWLSLVVGLVVFAAAAALRLFFLEPFGARIPYITFFPAVIIASLCGGLCAGVISTVLSACFVAYFLMEPTGQIHVRDQIDWLGLLIFLFSGVSVSWLSELTRRAQRSSSLAETRIKLAAEREKAAAALQESEARFRCYVENSPVAVFVVDRDGRYVDFNDAATRLLGYPADTLSRMNILEVHPIEDHAALLRDLSLLRETGRLEMEARLIKSSGEQVWVSLRAVLLDNGHALAYCQDITALKGAIDSITETKMRLELAAKSGGLGVWEWNVRQGWLEWNDRMFELYGVSRETFDRSFENWLGTVHEEDRERVRIGIESALKGEEDYHTQEFRVLRPDGRVVVVRGDAMVLRDDVGNPLRMVGLNRDITEQRFLEGQLLQAQKMEAIGRLAGGVAHDFNNKLSVILGYAELSRLVQVGTEKFHEYLSEIVKAAEHSRDVTHQLLTFSSNELITPCRVDLNRLILQAQRSLLQAIVPQIQLDLSLAQGIWPVLMDPVQVNQVITNLVLNSCDAMPQGGTISIETKNVTICRGGYRVDAEPAPGEYVMVSVRDTGVGMDSELQKKVFEPFFTTKGIGLRTGLGLSTVYGIMNQNGGAVQLHSEPGQGSTFTLYFPRIAEQKELPLPLPTEFSRTGCVLLVENEGSVRRMVQLMLEKAGYQVLVAESHPQALEILHTCKGGIDCLVAETVLPEWKSVELSRAIREISPGTGVLYMSGYSADVATHDAPEQGILFIRKPFDFMSLMDKIQLAIRSSRP